LARLPKSKLKAVVPAVPNERLEVVKRVVLMSPTLTPRLVPSASDMAPVDTVGVVPAPPKEMPPPLMVTAPAMMVLFIPLTLRTPAPSFVSAI